MSRRFHGMDTRNPASPSPAHLVDDSLRHAREVIDQVFEVAARCDVDLSLQTSPSTLRLAILRELAFDVAVARDEMSRHAPAQDPDAALRDETLQGLLDAKTVLSHLIEAEQVALERLAASGHRSAPEHAARRA